MIERLCIVGVGLIGGSLARSLRRTGFCKEIVGCSRNAGHLEQAQSLGVIDRYETDVGKAITGAGVILLAVPLGAMKSLLQAIKPVLEDGQILTDAGSAKAVVVNAAREVFGELPPGFVPGHPIAGTERSGVEASFDGLFESRKVILTPELETSAEALAKVRAMWEAAGAEVVEMEASHHDAVLAATSHLPHVLAFSLVDSLAAMGDREEMFEYAAGGFRDFTRIASSDPVMWRDICVANSEAIVAMLERYAGDLEIVRKSIASRNGEEILRLFREAKSARDRFIEQLEPAVTPPESH